MMALSSTPANVPAKKSIKKPGTHRYRLTQKELPEDGKGIRVSQVQDDISLLYITLF
jgi:hypothetical protein